MDIKDNIQTTLKAPYLKTGLISLYTFFTFFPIYEFWGRGVLKILCALRGFGFSEIPNDFYENLTLFIQNNPSYGFCWWWLFISCIVDILKQYWGGPQSSVPLSVPLIIGLLCFSIEFYNASWTVFLLLLVLLSPFGIRDCLGRTQHSAVSLLFGGYILTLIAWLFIPWNLLNRSNKVNSNDLDKESKSTPNMGMQK